MAWIKLKDEKPHLGTPVLIYMEGRSVLVAVLLNIDLSPARKWWAIFSTGAHPVDDPSLITHWQPLPDPPQNQ